MSLQHICFFLHEVLWLGKSRFQFYSFFFIFVILCRSMTVYEGRAFWRPKKLYGLGFWAGIWALLYDLEYPCGESSALPRRWRSKIGTRHDGSGVNERWRNTQVTRLCLFGFAVLLHCAFTDFLYHSRLFTFLLFTALLPLSSSSAFFCFLKEIRLLVPAPLIGQSIRASIQRLRYKDTGCLLVRHWRPDRKGMSVLSR